jgi:t-SNARE complex subunit (syntaxin)
MKTLRQFVKEELNDKQKKIVSTWHRDPTAIAATDHFFGKGNDDVFEPLQNGVNKSEVHRAVERHLGQEIPSEDYKAGHASDKYGRRVKIGALLQKTKATPDLINQFSNDNTRQLKSETNMKVRITRSPEGVAGQTSGTQSWVGQSCKNFDDGVHRSLLPYEVRHGTVVAYLHNKDGKELARATLQPYRNKTGDRIYLHNSYYGPSVKEFEDHVNDIASRLSTQKVSADLYHIHPDVYNDDGYSRAFHPKVTQDHISKALDDKDLTVRRYAIGHPKVTEDHITKALDDENFYQRYDAITHPKVTEDHITKALDDENGEIRKAAIRHPKATKDHITKALDDKDSIVRRSAIAHPKATEDHITKALDDENRYVRVTAAIKRSKQLTESREKTHKITFRQLRESREKIHKINDFVSFACKHLDLEQPPEINYVNDKTHAFENRSFGSYHIGKNTINVNVAERHVADIIRTLAHEMVHYKQDVDGRLDGIEYAGETGSTFENEANSEAGVMLRNYGRSNPHIYEAVIKLGGASDGAKNFMDELHSTTEAHPWDPRIRIINGNVTVEASKIGNTIHLHDIVSHAPRSGAGTKALNHLKALADKHGVELEGVAKGYTDEGGRISSSNRLKKWYIKNGFTASYGSAEDGYDISYKP